MKAIAVAIIVLAGRAHLSFHNAHPPLESGIFEPGLDLSAGDQYGRVGESHEEHKKGEQENSGKNLSVENFVKIFLLAFANFFSRSLQNIMEDEKSVRIKNTNERKCKYYKAKKVKKWKKRKSKLYLNRRQTWQELRTTF